MLKTHEEIKGYVIDTIKTGNKVRIQKVLARYQKYLKERKSSYDNARRIFAKFS